MVDQDAPLDLTIKKASAEPSEQGEHKHHALHLHTDTIFFNQITFSTDGVLDLSIKRSRNSISVPVCDTGLPPVTSAPKG